MNKILLEKGMVVQITPEHSMFGGCLAIVTEPKDFGAQAYISCPKKRGELPDLAFCRLNFNEMELIGKAEWVIE